MSGQIDVIRKDIASVRTRFETVAVDKSLTFEREAGFAVQALSANEYAMKIAIQARDSVISAVVNIAAIGISLNPARKQAYLVPRDGRICLDISYMGLLDLAISSGSIRWGQAELVYSSDEFEDNGVGNRPTHKRKPFAKDRGELIGVYVVVKTADGDFLTTTMSIDEVYAIRDRSAAWKAFISKKVRCPWATDEGEMVKKTAIKRAYKTWPKTERLERLENAVNYLNTEGGEGIELTNAGRKQAGCTPMSGAFDSLTEDQILRIRDVASKVHRGFDNLGAEAAADYIAEQEFDAEEETALWAMFDTESAMRAAIKTAQKNKRAALE